MIVLRHGGGAGRGLLTAGPDQGPVLARGPERRHFGADHGRHDASRHSAG
ncbi:hypothetical protein ACRAWD_17740 [Caulobacter segnis]